MKNLIFPLLISVLCILSCKSNAGENTSTISDHIKKKAIPMHSSADLDKLISVAADKKLVLLGEASHGTHEYYTWRDSISRRLINEHGFNFILVEGDYASLYELNRYIKNMPGAASSAKDVLMNLSRWPLWMWGNYEVLNLAEWLREYNSELPKNQRIGFYGIDVYDEWRSKQVLLDNFKKYYPRLEKKIINALSCYSPYQNDSWRYAQAVVQGQVDCSGKAREIVDIVYSNQKGIQKSDKEMFIYLLQNAYVFKNAEKFYIKSVRGDNAGSWNSRVMHMHNTSIRLLDYYGADAKGIVWAHNTHIGDASFTDMGRFGQTNIGELSRNHFGKENVLLVGFSTFMGRVQAGSQWGSQRQEMNVIRAQKNSIEEILNRTGIKTFYLIFDEDDRKHEEFMKPLGNRAIGVVYNPQNDFRQYVNTIVPMRYDALIFFKETKALYPLKD